MDPDKTLESPETRPSRFGSAWMALRGDPVIPASIRAEWAVVQIQLQNLLDQITAAAARAYERDRVKLRQAQTRIEELEVAAQVHDVTPDMPIGTGWNPEKIALNRLIMACEAGESLPTFLGGPDVDGIEARSG